ncbi:CcmD family protein [Flavobacteriales bacterium]|nr:CcmD family protein [Flavobacteriales bacterium]
MNKKITFITLAFIAFFNNFCLAQDSSIEQTMHESGKINVVVAVVVVIFIGLAFYLIRLDRKISKIEKETEN